MKPIDRAGLRAPACIVDLELHADPGGTSVDVRGYETLWGLVRAGGVPVAAAFWDVAGDSDIEIDALRRSALETTTTEGRPAGLPAPSTDDLTVALCTRNRPDELRRALLSLSAQTDRDFGVVVVDNAPDQPTTRDVVAELALPECRYLEEAQPGLSRARNAALAAVSTPLVAWMDDDETADPTWIERLRQGFGHPCQPAAVCGLMLPAELETEAQVRFEQYGGFNKGRGFVPEVLSVATGSVRSPMYPLPGFGAGGNMAFRTDSLRQVGGFDPNLGAGTPTHGGEETRALALVLRAGGSVLHWPAAITWHYHRRELRDLHAQFRGYSAGLSAFFASMLLTAPAASTRELMRILPTAIAHLRPGRGNRRIGALPADFPPDLIRAGRAGFAEGAGAYLRERRTHRSRTPRAREA